jgi:gamma-glutamylputrescine oxidase
VNFGFEGFDHLLENSLEGGLHSGKTVQALLQKVQGMGVQVLTGFEVIEYKQKDDHLEVYTKQGIDFTTRQLLLCTNAFTRQLVPDLDIIPNRGQVLVTSELPGIHFRGTFHFDQGYYYFRNLGNRLLIGGARNKSFEQENTTEFQTTAIIQEELERFTRTHILPGIDFAITDRWSGIMAMGAEKMPLVQELEDNVFCCVRMSGMGVALAPVVAGQVAALMSK